MRRFSFLIWLALATIACNLSSSANLPPTVAPRYTDQPIATLGYSTPAPGTPLAFVTPVGTLPQPAGSALYTMLSQVESDRLMMHVTTLQGFHTRHVDSVGRTDGKGITAAAEYINEQFEQIERDSNGNFSNHGYHEFNMTWNNTKQRNIFGVINPIEANSQAIIVGAHYDSRTNDLRDGTSAAPGADDNGSGVAAVIELARILSKYPSRAPIIFVLFAGEEQGRYGSIAFVRDYIQRYNIPTMVMINLDTIGSTQDNNGVVNDSEIRLFADPKRPGARYMAQMITFIAVNTNADLELVLQDAMDREGRFGDHQSFNDVGIPAVRLIEAHEDNRRREGLDFVEYVEPDYLRKSTRTVLAIVASLANGPRPPEPGQIVVRDGESGVRRLVWEPVPNAVSYVVALRRPGSRTFDQLFRAYSTAYDYEGFNSAQFEALAIAAVDASGMMGPLSAEYRIP